MNIRDYLVKDELAIKAAWSTDAEQALRVPTTSGEGTSEGAKKGWEERSRHQDYGKFERNYPGAVGLPASKRYSFQSDHSIVSVHESQTGRGTSVVREYSRPDTIQVDKQKGPTSGLQDYLKSRYGIIK